MEQLNLITNFLRIKDQNILITDEYDMGTHLELHGQSNLPEKLAFVALHPISLKYQAGVQTYHEHHPLQKIHFS